MVLKNSSSTKTTAYPSRISPKLCLAYSPLTTINEAFPPDITENNYFQESLRQQLKIAQKYYDDHVPQTTLHGGIKFNTVDTDLLGAIYDLTAEFENSTLLQTLGVVMDTVTEHDPRRQGTDVAKVSHAQRIARILILQEMGSLPG